MGNGVQCCSLLAMCLIRLLTNLSIFLTSWAASVLYWRHTTSSVILTTRHPSLWLYLVEYLTWCQHVSDILFTSIISPSLDPVNIDAQLPFQIPPNFQQKAWLFSENSKHFGISLVTRDFCFIIETNLASHHTSQKYWVVSYSLFMISPLCEISLRREKLRQTADPIFPFSLQPSAQCRPRIMVTAYILTMSPAGVELLTKYWQSCHNHGEGPY